ncbi:hypothetical protein CYMTET_36949 [Cymbomonas tetramitiformis]|uniref:Uncharacterized protein n=1 Tax=Cymbomonas tetramitiformis TaxID=36881 RepID=A0AAE0CEZ7_9CHLO|nr:hypothetical protein CYMTET_36949 [Cymbomonas tetramitiformis]
MLAAFCVVQPALAAADPPAFLTKAASAHVEKTFKNMANPGGKAWSDAMRSQAMPAVHLTKKKFVPAERTTIPEGMRLGHLQDWKAAQANFLKSAEKHFASSAADERENSQTGINRELFKGNSVNINQLGKAMVDKLKGLAGSWKSAVKKATVARGISPKVGTKDAMKKDSVSGFARPWATGHLRKLKAESRRVLRNSA